MNRVFCGLVVVLALLAGRAEAERMQWLLRSADVVWSDVGAGEYVVAWTLPERLNGLRVELAKLEVWMNSEAWEEEHVPYVVRVSGLKSYAEGAYQVAEGTSATGFAVSTGSDRIVVDVTKMMRSWRGREGTVYGLIASGDGTNTVPALRAGVPAPGVIARLTVYGLQR